MWEEYVLELIYKFAKEISRILNIEEPTIELDPDYDWGCSDYRYYDDKVIIVEEKDSIESLFSVAHEIRHKWQIVYNPEFYFKDYKQLDCIEKSNYGMQKAEIDANAFAMIAMCIYFENMPIFQNCNDDERKEIFDRAQEISNVYGFDFDWKSFREDIGI